MFIPKGLFSKQIEKAIQNPTSILQPSKIVQQQESLFVIPQFPMAEEQAGAAESGLLEALAARMGLAFRGKDPKEIDDFFRKETGEFWRAMTMDQRAALHGYTGPDYGKINSILREGGDWGIEKYAIENITSAIENSSYQKDIVLNRMMDMEGGLEFLGLNKLPNLSEKNLKTIIGTDIIDPGFVSTRSIIDNNGPFRHRPVSVNIFAPEGTKMIYAEPFSALGRGHKLQWDGFQEQDRLGDELEMLLQRSTKFKILDLGTEIENGMPKINADIAVLEQKI